MGFPWRPLKTQLWTSSTGIATQAAIAGSRYSVLFRSSQSHNVRMYECMLLLNDPRRLISKKYNIFLCVPCQASPVRGYTAFVATLVYSGASSSLCPPIIALRTEWYDPIGDLPVLFLQPRRPAIHGSFHGLDNLLESREPHLYTAAIHIRLFDPTQRSMSC